MLPVNSGFYKRKNLSGNYRQFGHAPCKTGLLNILRSAGNFGKFWFACG